MPNVKKPGKSTRSAIKRGPRKGPLDENRGRDKRQQAARKQGHRPTGAGPHRKSRKAGEMEPTGHNQRVQRQRRRTEKQTRDQMRKRARGTRDSGQKPSSGRTESTKQSPAPAPQEPRRAEPKRKKSTKTDRGQGRSTG